MERISIFNYEAYYLDFLEGNLNEEDAALLLAFLEENPDLKLDDDELPSYDEESISITSNLKNRLKQPDMGDEITLENVEHFMIANVEGLLDPSKSQELSAFINENADLSKDSRIYKEVYFEADPTVVYNDKESLKKKTIVLWPYAASVAAILLIAFLLVWSSMEGPLDTSNNVVAEDTIEENLSVEDNELNAPDINPDNSPDYLKPNSVQQSEQYTFNSVEPEKSPEVNDKNIGRMDRIPVGNVLTALSTQELEPISSPTFAIQQEENKNEGSQALASASMTGQMENPIEPITNFLSEKTNTEIDFKRTKKDANPKEGKGFFIKIGKFEFSRKKH